MQTDSNGKKGWFDTTISLQWILGGLLAGMVGIGGISWTWAADMQKGRSEDKERISRLESSDREHEKHFSRIEGAVAEQRSDSRDSLRGISQDIKDLSNKVDQLKDQMIANSVANRPEVQKWSRP